MPTQKLKDRRYRTIGYIETRSDGTQVIKDARYKKLGTYDPKHDVTKDARFRTVGHGNLLTSLLPANEQGEQGGLYRNMRW